MSLQSYQYIIRTYRVVDGDTIKMDIDLGFNVYTTQSCRLFGLDAPEHNTAAGAAVTSVVTAWCAKYPPSQVTSSNWDKYAGRFDGVMYGTNQPQTINEFLLTNELARPYAGGAKPPWSDTELAAIVARASTILAAW